MQDLSFGQSIDGDPAILLADGQLSPVETQINHPGLGNVEKLLTAFPIANKDPIFSLRHQNDAAVGRAAYRNSQRHDFVPRPER